MNFYSLVWYSSLAIDQDKNNYVADFLKKSCQILNQEIHDEIKEKNLPFNFNIDFLHVDRGEEGVEVLKNKLSPIHDIIFTNGHSINKYNANIIDVLKNKNFFYFPQNLTKGSIEQLDENIKKRIFKLSRADQDAKIVFINDEINSYKDKKVYFFHQNLRLSEKLINQHQQTDYFVQFSFKDFDLEKLNNKFDELLKDLSKDDLIVVDLNLSIFKPLFDYLIEKKHLNKVITTFGSLQNRFEKIPFDLIQLVGNHDIPSVAIEDLMSKVYGQGISATEKTLLLDSTFRLEVPLLAFEALKKIYSKDHLEIVDTANIEDQFIETLHSFNGKSDIFVGKRIQYAFNENNENLTRENYAFFFPNSLQTEKYKIPKVFYPKQFCSVNNEVKAFDTVFSYIDVLRVTNINIQDKTWTAEFYLDLVSKSSNPLEDIIFNNLSSNNDKFVSKIIWEKKDKNDFTTVRYYIVASFDFLAIADNYPFDWQSLYISTSLKDSTKQILQPIPLELVDNEFDINEWAIENSFSGIKYKKNYLYQDTDLQKTVVVTKENRLGWIIRRKNTATLLKIGIPMFFLIFLVYYSVFLGFEKSSESIGILTTTFLSAIALYFSVEKPEPKKMTIVDIIFIWFYIVNGLTITIFSLSSLITEKIHTYSSGLLKYLIPFSLVSIATYLFKRVKNNRKDILLDRDL